MAVAKPIILPDTFSGEGRWDDWAVHFEHCADINRWAEDDKLRFLKVRLIGRAQSVFQRLSDDQKDTCEHAMDALRQWFEPASKRELYLTELSTRRRRPTESWANFADDLRRLSSRAYPDLGQKATDQLALTHYLMALTDVQIALHVKQRSPTKLEEAVGYTLQVEAALATARIASTCSTTDDTLESIPANAVQKSGPEEKLLALVEKLDQRLNVIEDRMTTSRPAYNRRPRPPQQRSGPPKEVVCFKCRQVGHYARGCAATKPQNQGN